MGILRSFVCNFVLNVGIIDIFDWCYVEVFGKEGFIIYFEVFFVYDLSVFY